MAEILETNVLETMTGDIPFSDLVSLGECHVPNETPALLFTIGDKVILDNGCQPESWNTAVITGINLLVYNGANPAWEYCLQFDSPIGGKEWYTGNFYFKHQLQKLQEEWDLNDQPSDF
jgi:hypothetical protein